MSYGNQPYSDRPLRPTTLHPDTVARLKPLTLAAFALTMVNGLINVTSTNAQLDQIATSSLGAGSVTAGMLFGLVFVAGLYALVYFPLMKGQPWARVLGTVFCSIGLVGATVSVMGLLIGDLFSGLLGVAIIVVDVLWLRAAWGKSRA
ncbi:hypothetical protein [Mycetocola spongiae]|uniref:hypothetical protein n=1 Tax=Mycetocola spongiae TaxID=2859226 RepID=UPI001CF37DD3|nr:hypothetical protein [Mycetocola spongiae]UCR88512.1 hypothetical protein KXZ72_11160 [Mycetocola spongiae]